MSDKDLVEKALKVKDTIERALKENNISFNSIYPDFYRNKFKLNVICEKKDKAPAARFIYQMKIDEVLVTEICNFDFRTTEQERELFDIDNWNDSPPIFTRADEFYTVFSDEKQE